MSIEPDANQLRVVLDTNIIISALLFPRSVPGAIVHLGLRKKPAYKTITSPALIQELQEVMQRDDFDLKRDLRDDILALYHRKSHIAHPKQRLNVVQNDITDNKVIEAAVAGQASFIVTGDRRHLLSLKEYQSIIILSARHFLAKLRSRH